MMKEEILLKDSENVETKPNKLKIALSILASTLIVATITTLLVGHFKYDWFKSDEYKIDAHINRSIFQANYFSEKKTINSKFSYDDFSEEKVYVVDNDFVVYLTDKKGDLNTATLVLLGATVSVDNEIHELPHLNMFDEEQIKALESNPDGSKYPMAVFKFTDDGEIKEINLPNNMDDYNAETIVGLINKVTPKLSRSKKEDMSNGLEITTKKVNNKRIIVQTEAPKEITDFRGSRYTKVLKTEIENDEVTSVQSDDNLHMESKPEDDEIQYGPQDFYYNVKSEISKMDVKYNEKENAELAKKLVEKFTLIESEVLRENLKQKAEKETEIELPEEEAKEIRGLASLPSISASKTFNLASFNVLGQKVSVKYEVGIKSGRAFNKIVVSSKLGGFEFGLTSISGEINWSKSYSQTIFYFIVPPPFSFIQLRCYVKGSIAVGFGIKAALGQGSKLWAKISGSLGLGAEVSVGLGRIASLSAFAEGTIVDASAQVTLINGSVSKDSGFRITIGRLKVGIKGKLLWWKKTLWSKTIYNGYTFK